MDFFHHHMIMIIYEIILLDTMYSPLGVLVVQKFLPKVSQAFNENLLDNY